MKPFPPFKCVAGALGIILIVELMLNAAPGLTSPAQDWSSPDCEAPHVDLHLLLLAADGSEAAIPAIRETLDYLGTPYTVWVVNQLRSSGWRLTDSELSDGCHARYQAVILTTGELQYTLADGVAPRSALDEAEWETLWRYEARFGLRQLTWYTYPTPQYGFDTATATDTAVTPIAASLTPAGEATFNYLNARTPLTIQGAYAYLARPLDERTTPLLTDPDGNALVAVRTYPDGRENLAVTFSHPTNDQPTIPTSASMQSSPIHHLLLAYGLINWVTKGLFVGERHVFLSAQVDDVFIPNFITTGGIYRMTGSDLYQIRAWQQATRARPTTQAFRLDLAFNGIGSVSNSDTDTLVPVAAVTQSEFKWISHTYSHLELDDVSYSQSRSEIRRNNERAEQLSLRNYSPASLVTPGHTGLENPQFLRAARTTGVRYLVADSSREGYRNPSPNAGIYNRYQPGLLMIPRHPTNLFSNVSTPDEWLKEYYSTHRFVVKQDLTYAELLNAENQVLLRYLLKGDVSPLMFHQANLRAYDGIHTLLGDLLDRTIEKYEQVFTLPILSPTMDELGERVAARMQYNKAGVRATLVGNRWVTLYTDAAATIPVTGLRTGEAEFYGGQPISHVSLAAKRSVTLPLDGEETRSAPTGGLLAIGGLLLALPMVGVAAASWRRARQLIPTPLAETPVAARQSENGRSEGLPSRERTAPLAANGDSTRPEADLAPMGRQDDAWSAIRHWVYWLDGPRLEQIAEAGFDLAVIDYSSDGSSRGEFSSAEIAALRQASGTRRVVAYLSVGQAEDYRFYWQAAWRQAKPAWLGAQDPDWPGHYWVRYWDPGWQQLVYQYLDRIIAQGFDGVYLDRIDAYAERYAAGRERDMVRFVLDIARYARARSPLHDDFGVIVQNAEELGVRHPDYLAAVTGIAREEVYVRATDRPTTPFQRASTEAILDRYRQGSRSRLVLTVDYANKRSIVSEAYERAIAKGYVPYVTDVGLNRLRLNAGYEPSRTADVAG